MIHPSTTGSPRQVSVTPRPLDGPRETPWLGPWSPPASQFPDSTAAGRPACADMPMFDVFVIAAVRVARWQLAEAGLFWLRLFGTLGI